ncbi:MAG: YybH family protein [Pseudonocardiaceae bacterium]
MANWSQLMEVSIGEPPRSPQQVNEQLSQYLGKGDIDGALSLYEADSVFSPRPGETITGLDLIRGALEEFAALNPTMKLGTPNVLEADGVALVTCKWRITGTQPGGATIEMDGYSTDVMRRQPDGSWKFLIDNPWGTET